MTNYIDTTFFSLSILTFFIFSFLFWLVIRTLKEGRKAFEETNKN